MTEVVRAPRWLAPAALFVFALSGCSGLIYQSIWSQYLGLYLGHAAYAQSLVLAIFMGGMAIGAWWASRRSLRWRNLLFAYAAIELVIGIAAALFHPVYSAVTGFAYDSVFPALPTGGIVQAFKWSSGALLILPQAILLGTTFPLMSNGLMRRLRSGDGAILSGLYFTNSIGAALGALLATFVLLPAIGLPGAMRFGAVLNVLVALAAFLLGRRAEEAPLVTPASPAVASAGVAAGAPRLLLTAAFITGATSFVYEIGWVRMLSLVFGSTVHAFELMLAAFIGGLAFGGLWIRKRIDGYARPIRVGGWVQILMGLAALASLLLYDHTFDWVAWLMRALSRTDSGYDAFNVITAAVSMLMMAPAAFFAGMTLPLFTLTLIRSGGGEAAVGRIYAANTIGAILGVFATVHLLIPGFGLKLAMIIAAAGDLALGLVLLRRSGTSARAADVPYLGGLATCGLALAIALVGARFDPAAMAGGVYRSAIARLPKQLGEDVLFYRDGKTASVAVRSNARGVRAIATNGKVDAAIHMSTNDTPAPDEMTMVMAAVVPLMYHPEPRTAAVIGFGSGLTTNALLGDPRLERVDTIEIEPSMIEGAKLFGQRVERGYKDPRSHLHIEDARTYFAANRSRYDLILSEPSNPWVSGVASLFSREFYDFIPRHLAPRGLFVQWVQLYEINDELVGSVVTALSDHFSDYRIYLAYNSDMLIVARADGMIGDLHGEALLSPGLKSDLERLGIASVEEVRAHQLGDRRSLAPFFQALTQRANSDYYPILSLEAPRARFTSQNALAIQSIALADLPYREMLAGLPAPAPASIKEMPIYGYTGLLHHAADVAAALRGKVNVENAGADAPAVAFLRDAVSNCKATQQGPMLEGLVRIVGGTLPFLDEAARKAVWAQPDWIHCDALPDNVRALLSVISRLATHDLEALQREATALLDDPAVMRSSPVRDWLVRAATLAAARIGDEASLDNLSLIWRDAHAGDPARATFQSWALKYGRNRLQTRSQ